MKEKQWKIEYDIPELPSELVSAGYPPLLAYVLSKRGITDPAEADTLIYGGSTLMHDPFLMKGMPLAVERIRQAIANGEKIAVYGDYDVDGITSTCLLKDYLSSKGLSVTPYIPDRNEEGYGLNCNALDAFHADGVSLVITVDCGITAVDETEYANSLGIDMIITDHHECKGSVLPDAFSVVDCKQSGDNYPNPGLAGVGVAFKLACAVEGDSLSVLEKYSDLLAIGTVADVMPLTGENRYFVKTGIEKIRHAPRLGVNALLQETVSNPQAVTASTIGYTLAPRINAAGRLQHAIMAAKLLMSEDPSEAASLASELCSLNSERQKIENDIWKEAIQCLSEEDTHSPIVLASDEWNSGVIGIAASRLAEQFSLPTIMIRLNGEIGKGSCRSYGGFNLFDALSACSEHLVSFGGHALAAGLNIERNKIDDFRQALAAYYAENIPEQVPEVVCELLIADPELLTVDNVRSLDLLEPYGNCNPKPVFCMTGLKIESFSNVGNGKHLKMKLSSGSTKFDCIFFSHTSDEFSLRIGDCIDLAFSPQINEFRGSVSVQLTAIALRHHDCTELCANILEADCSYAKAASVFCPERNDFIKVWKNLGRDFQLGDNLGQILSTCPEGMSPEMYCICLSVFRQAGLLNCCGTGIYGATYDRRSGKADLDATELLRRLRTFAE